MFELHILYFYKLLDLDKSIMSLTHILTNVFVLTQLQPKCNESMRLKSELNIGMSQRVLSTES